MKLAGHLIAVWAVLGAWRRASQRRLRLAKWYADLPTVDESLADARSATDDLAAAIAGHLAPVLNEAVMRMNGGAFYHYQGSRGVGVGL